MHRLQRDNRMERPGHFVGLKWQDGWWFIQVLGTSVEELKPWTLLNEHNGRGDISAQTAGTEDEIRDENDRLLLEPNDSERGLVFQLLFGIEPSRMQLFPSFGRDQNLGLEDSIAPGEDEMWVTGFDSPYNNPSAQSEILYVNDMETLRLQAYNPMDRPDEAKLSIHINKLRYATVTNVDMMKAMLQNQIRSSKHMMGLGARDQHQLSTPEWLQDIFGEHIRTSEEILSEGDAQQGRQIAGQLDLRSSTAIASETGGG